MCVWTDGQTDEAILILYSRAGNKCTGSFNKQELFILYLWVYYYSHCKQKLFP